jgi:glyoxylase-like metal-dependent hydrolase (beta-lactamase superfamily II)
VGTTLSHVGHEPQLLRSRDILCVRAPNPGPFTLSGTNTWLVGRAPTWIVDPGPLIDAHLALLESAIEARGGLGGIALTHDHRDHSEAAQTLRAAHHVPLAGARGGVDVQLAEGARFGRFAAVSTPGHAPDHFALLSAGACFSGDAVLGQGSVFIWPDPGAMSGYLRALARLRARGDLEVICPGHGPVVWDANAKLDEYLAHRAERERRLIEALGEGQRSVAELLDRVWAEVPEVLRPAARVTLAAHLDKLEEEGALPPGVERPDVGARASSIADARHRAADAG